MTEADFIKALEVVAIKNGLTRSEKSMVAMHCEENGSDCGERQWEVAINTLNELVDQGLVMNVALNRSAY